MLKFVQVVAVLATGLVSVTICAGTPANAYGTMHDHRLKYGIVNQKYWISPSASGQSSGISKAFKHWNATSTPASWAKTTTQSKSHIDLYKVSTINSWWGITSYFIDTTHVNPEKKNWWWAKIRLDGDWTHCPNKVGAIGHEIGHAMGLDHVYGGNPRLMRADLASLSTKKPWPDDVNGINHLY